VSRFAPLALKRYLPIKTYLISWVLEKAVAIAERRKSKYIIYQLPLTL
jgi:hypothetical protein